MLPDENTDYVEEDHIHSFAKALIWDDLEELLAAPSLISEVAKSNHAKSNDVELSNESNNDATRPARIVSKSDWFPVGGPRRKPPTKESLSATQRLTSEFRNLASYMVLRWPVLVLIFLYVLLLCALYALVRAYVALLEYFFTWTGERKKLRDRLRNSASYDEWVRNAVALDKFLGLDQWSRNPHFSYYDYRSVQRTLHRIRSLRRINDVAGLMALLQGCLKKNFAGIENNQLYSHRYYGTKDLVHEYIDEVVRCIDCVTAAPPSVVLPQKKAQFFRVVLKNYGRSALCLSGGACFAYTHFGIVRAMVDNDALPLIISGTSGGGLIAALACTRTNDELKQLLVPELAKKIRACEEPWYVWLPRFWRTGARFDSLDWAKKSAYFTRGSTTFQDAYKRTGRKLNVSTVPAETSAPAILCNTITSPDCLIWSSLLASAAVPGVLNPVILMTKDHNGKVVPFSMGSKWRDGSLRTDIPVDALNTYYNVNFSVVSQVNPHISLFFFAPKGAVGRPVALSRKKTKNQKFASLRGGFVATFLEQLFKLEIRKCLEIVKALDLLPMWLEQDWLDVWLQKFTGTITIWPRNRFKDFWYILSDPNEAQMESYLMRGQRSMWPKLLFVKHRLSIERAIERGRKLSRARKLPDSGFVSRAESAMGQSDEGQSDSTQKNVDAILRALHRNHDMDSTDAELTAYSQNRSPRNWGQMADSGDSGSESESQTDDEIEDNGKEHDIDSINDSINDEVSPLGITTERAKHRRNTVF